VVLAVAGLVTLGIGLRRLVQARATRSWPTHTATIVRSQVSERVDTQQTDDGSRDVTLFAADIEFQWVGADGVTRKGTKVRPDSVSTSNRATAQAEVDRFAVGATVPVSVNPSDNADGVLLPGISGGSALVPAAGAALLVTAAGIAAIVAVLSRASGR
jgi:Protein of unknown function (DUF3592)